MIRENVLGFGTLIRDRGSGFTFLRSAGNYNRYIGIPVGLGMSSFFWQYGCKQGSCVLNERLLCSFKQVSPHL